MSGVAQSRAEAAARAFRARKYRFYDEWVRSGELTILELRLAWRLIDRLNPRTGDCWPSLAGIASELGCNLRALKRTAKRLEEKGWFIVQRGGGRHRSNHYTPNWTKTIESPQEIDETGTKTVTRQHGNGGRPKPKTVAGQPPESVNESRSEPAEGTWKQIGRVIADLDTPIARQGDLDEDGGLERWTEWLYRQGHYLEAWGDGSRGLAAEDLEKLRQACGDAGAVRCLRAARDRGLFGPVLRRHVETGPRFYGRHPVAA